MKKRILASLMLALMLLGTTATCLAGTDGVTRSITSIFSTATFSHFVSTGQGQSLRVEQQVTERHPTTEDVYTDVHNSSSVGMATSVYTERRADAGYRYLRIDWTKSYLNSSLYSELPKLDV